MCAIKTALHSHCWCSSSLLACRRLPGERLFRAFTLLVLTITMTSTVVVAFGITLTTSRRASTAFHTYGSRTTFRWVSSDSATVLPEVLRGFTRSQGLSQSKWRLQSTRLSSTASDSGNVGDKKRVVFLGTPEVAASSLQTIYQASLEPSSPFELVAVVTQPPKRRKRKKKAEPSAVGKLAEELGVDILCPESAKDDDFLTDLETRVKPDLCITAAYGQYLPKRFLALPQCGTVNIHPSLLPKWRGASPVQRSLEAGENPVGVSVLFTVSKMDAGPIIAQKEQTIDENDTAITVLPMLFEIGTELLLETLPDVLSGKITMEKGVIPQDDALATKADMIAASEAELKVWEESATTCHNRLRGFANWPQTFMYVQVGGQPDPIKIKVLETRVVHDIVDAEPTDIISLGPTKKSGLYVTCGDGSVLELLIVQPATRKAFPARDFQNGYPGETIRWVRPPVEEESD